MKYVVHSVYYLCIVLVWLVYAAIEATYMWSVAYLLLHATYKWLLQGFSTQRYTAPPSTRLISQGQVRLDKPTINHTYSTVDNVCSVGFFWLTFLHSLLGFQVNWLVVLVWQVCFPACDTPLSLSTVWVSDDKSN